MHFYWSLLCKVYKVWPKVYRRVIFHENEVSGELSFMTLTKNRLMVSKMIWWIWWIFTRTLRNLKIFTFIGYFCPKYIMFELKKYRGVVFYDNEEGCKIWRIKLTFGLENDAGNLVNFHQNTWKCLNWNFDGTLLSKIENAWAKKLQRSYVYRHWRMMKKLKRNWLVSKLT